ncbi:MAG: hypothetical protein HKN52_03805 [Eudoraea sp.]|nr:hypothetical protein [Eudoraea sp.]
MKLFWQVFGLVLILLPLTINSQEIDTKKEVIAFYTAMAKKDALFEQAIQLDAEDDEVDFWNDQKKFEQDLKHKDYTAYKAYLQGKNEAYNLHEQHCDTSCKHGEYYNLQASFYYTYGSLDYVSALAKAHKGNMPLGTGSISKY